MPYRPYPDRDRALRRLSGSAAALRQGEYRISTRRGDHDFQYGDDHVQRCTRCRHPHSQWSGGSCPGRPQDWGPGRYI